MQELVMGILAAVGSMFFFGSFAVPMRTPAVLDAKMDPIIFQFYKSSACFLTSWLVLIYTPLKFTWWGMLGALIWVITGSAAVLAVQLVGIGLAQSLWSSLSIIVSYIWGAYIFKEDIQNRTLSIVSVFVMMIGMLGVASVSGKGWIDEPRMVIPDSVCTITRAEDLTSSLLIKDQNLMTEDAQVNANQVQKSKVSRMKGISLAALIGVLNGSFMIPLKYANKDVVGAEYLVSFGVGSMVMTTFVLGTYWCSNKVFKHQFPSFEFKVGAGPALLTGLFWSSGNYLSIYATLYLGVSVGWPLVQCQLLVSACWAVFYYREVPSNTAAGILVASSLVVVGGAVMLSYFGTVG